MEDWYFNPSARDWKAPNLGDSQALSSFHSRCLPNYSTTPLVDVTPILQGSSIGRVFLKDESSRLGLPAFKILGASWAIFDVLCARFKLDPSLATLDEVRASCEGASVSLYAATDGNHGRAVARMADILRVPCFVFVPEAVSMRSRSFIASEGATVIQIAGDYDASVVAAQTACNSTNSSNSILVQDTAWEGYTSIPMQIVHGYTTMYTEIDQQLRSYNMPSPALVVVPVGVGSLAHAAVLHYRSKEFPSPPLIMTVEPRVAACLLASLQAGKSMTVATSQTIMAGLNCGTVSSLAWPDLLSGVDIATSITDGGVDRSIRDLADLGISSGPCGAATIAALHSLIEEGSKLDSKILAQLDSSSVVVVISSESSEVYLDPAL